MTMTTSSVAVHASDKFCMIYKTMGHSQLWVLIDLHDHEPQPTFIQFELVIDLYDYGPQPGFIQFELVIDLHDHEP